MKPKNKRPKKSNIHDLAVEFSNTLNQQLEVAVLPSGVIAYKHYLIKKTKQGNWAIHQASTKDFVGEFFLKTCALMAAQAYDKINLTKFNQIKLLDNQYQASHMDNIIYTKNIKTAKDFERYLILLNKLEESSTRTEYYKDEISRMFKWSFV